MTAKCRFGFTTPSRSRIIFVFAGTIDEEPSDPKSVLLVVEVAKSSLTFDRGQKLALYAQSGYREYWILNLADQVLEVYRDPTRSADGSWSYADKTTVRSGGSTSPLSKPDAVLKVDDLLPNTSDRA